MKKILLLLAIIPLAVSAQRSIPRGGSVGQIMKIGTDGVNIAWANPGATMSFISPLSVNTNTVSISKANTETNGYLSYTDWNTFNGKYGTSDASSLSINNKLVLRSGNGNTRANAFINDKETSSTSYTLSLSTPTILAYTGSVTATVTLPDSNAYNGQLYTIKNLSTSTVTVVDQGGTTVSTINGGLTARFQLFNAVWEKEIASDLSGTGNTVSASVATASTNKIKIILNGTTYYLLVTTVP